MILTAIHTGMRYSELIGLEWDNVDFFNNNICVRRANVHGHVGTPKSNRIRYIPMTTELTSALSTHPRSNHLVFAYKNDWIRYELSRLKLAKICKMAGIKKIAWHALRHTFASNLASAGIPLNAIQTLLGHSTINMTMRYSHLNKNDLKKAISVLDNQINGQMSTWRQSQSVTLKNSSIILTSQLPYYSQQSQNKKALPV